MSALRSPSGRRTVHAARRSHHRGVRGRVGAALGVTGLLMSIAWWQAAPVLAATFTVTTTADTGAGSLREAIVNANGHIGADTITFAIPGVGPHTIALDSLLPTVDEQTAIDASGEAIGGAPGVVLDGTGIADDVGLNENGLSFTSAAGESAVKALEIIKFPDSGILVNGAGGMTIQDSYIGTDGTADLGNGGYGIAILNSNDNQILDNVISGNGLPAGTGGCCSVGFGIWISDPASSGNVIQGNRIGTNAAGTAAIGNQALGIGVQSADNVIGGSGAGEGNLISGNGRAIQYSGPVGGNTFEGNRVGTTASGNAALVNVEKAVSFNQSSGTVRVGGTAAGAGNVITSNGIAIEVAYSSDVVIEGNAIGVGADGTTALGNATGISIYGSAGFEADGNTVGGSAAGAANEIANNGVGVTVGGNAFGNRISGNSIHDNTALGIDLDATGVTANDPGDGDAGPNDLTNFPVITSADGSNVGGTLDAAAGTYRVEVFANQSCDPSGNGEGTTLLTVGTGVTSPGSWTLDALPVDGTFLTATATNEATGSTSEFSQCFLVTAGGPAPGTWSGERTVGGGTFTGDTDTLAAGTGAPGGPAQFTYGAFDPLPNSGDGESGEWAYFTTAGSAGTIHVPWRWTGFSGFASVTVKLEAVRIGSGPDDVTTLVEAGPISCDPCTEPSGGFDYDGIASFDVQPGDQYGFQITTSNGDTNESLRGELVLGTQLPTDCADAQDLYGATTDGRYVILPTGGERFSVYCKDMAGAAGDYLELNPEHIGPGKNFSRYAAGAPSTGTDVTTSFTKLRFSPSTLQVDLGDRTFATSTGSLTHSSISDPHPVSSMPYATAMACNQGVSDGSANVDLVGTPFAVDDTWTPVGTASELYGMTVVTSNDQVVDVTANGFCGWRTPDPTSPSFYVFDTQPGQSALQLRYLNAPSTPTLATPVVFGSISRSTTTADLYARVGGVGNTPLTVQVQTAAGCTNGALVSPTVIGTAAATSDADGYVLFPAIAGITSGDFVSIAVSTPSVTGASPCVRTTADNDYWPKALPLAGASADIQDVIDASGKSRWYKFVVTPGQQITVKLSGLPADYDLAVFKDIGKAFQDQLVPQDAADLTKLSAEFAPAVFSPAVFSPAVFSPAVFSPDAYSPAVFSPAVFSPAVFSPAVFSPAVFSPAVFSPAVFSPAVFSPAVFSPAVFSPAVFSPAVFSPAVFSDQEIAQAFSSAQTRSIIGVSATAGTGDETVVVNSWNNTGEFYVRVSGHVGAFDPADLFTVSVTKGATSCAGVTDTTISPRADQSADGRKTIILTDSSKLALGDGSTGTLKAKLLGLAARSEVAGVDIVDVAADPRVTTLKAQAAANKGCPFATNLVAEEIKGIVDSYRANNPLAYVVIVGGDDVIPFFRYPDQSLLGQESGYFPPVTSTSASEASLRKDYVLSQDAYGSGVSVSLRASEFPVPGLAVGRLVETPTEISGVLDAYTSAGGAITPSSSLVTGYDFLADAADAIKAEFQAGIGTTPDTLITPNGKSPQDPASWTAAQLRTKLLGARHDAMFLAGHFSANSALAADFQTSVLTTELAASTVDLANTLVISAGCHSGYNLLDGDSVTGVTQPLDWAQAFARKRATLVAGTGYQYGDTDFLEYSERLYLGLVQQLRTGSGAVPLGQALVQAKLAYLATTPDIRGIHEKALLEATLFGLPMLGVNMTKSSSGPASGIIDPVEQPPVNGTDLGLATADLHVAPTVTPKSVDLLNPPYDAATPTYTTARWLNGPDGTVSNFGEPALPLDSIPVTSNDATQVLRGVGFRGGSFTDAPGIVPLTGAPATELRGVHAPFISPVYYPMRLWTTNYFGALGESGGTTLLVTPAQHKTDPATAGSTVRRSFTDVDVRLFYSSNTTAAALSGAPSIVDIKTTSAGGDVTFTAQVVGDPGARIHDVWVTWTGKTGDGAGGGTWQPVDLAQCVTPLPAACAGSDDSSFWVGILHSAPTSLRYVVQAASGTGLVAFDDNRGSYYAATAAGTPPPTPASASIALDADPTAGGFGSSQTVTATLSSTGPVSGKTIQFALGGSVRLATTDASGVATTSIDVTAAGDTTLSASFAGDDGTGPASTSRGFAVTKAATTLVLSGPTVLPQSGAGQVSAMLKSGTTPLTSRTVAFRVKVMPSGPETIQTAITDLTGVARVAVPTAALGTIRFTASFGAPVALPGGGTLDLTDPVYGPTPATPNFDVAIRKAQTITFTSTAPSAAVYGDTYTPGAKATPSSLTVTFSVSGACTLSSGKVFMAKSGSCTVTANQAGNTTYAPAAPVSQTFTIGLKPATLGYTGTMFVSAGSGSSTNVTLTAQVTKSSGGTVDLTKAPVTFQLFRSSNATTTADVTCTVNANASGVASCVKSLVLDDWTVFVSMPTNDYWTAAPADAVVLTVYQTTAAKYATGAGHVTDNSPNTLPVKVSQTRNKGYFGFAVSYKTGTTPQGMAIYSFRATDGYDYVFTTSSWTGGGLSFGTSANTASFSQKCSATVFNPATRRVVSGLGGTNFTCRYDVTDASTDKFAMSAYTSAGVLFHQVGTPTSQRSITGGGIVVKK